MIDIADRIADLLIEDHVDMMTENMRLRDERDALIGMLVELVAVINRDDDRDYFICMEAAPVVAAAIAMTQKGKH